MKTGRPSISDAEKRRRGTLDGRWTEAARAARKDEKVVSLFGSAVETIPPPPAGMHDDAAKEYWRWANALHQEGRLTTLWVERIQHFAIAKHNIAMRMAAGQLPRADDMKAAKSILSELGAINADTPISPGEPQGRKFARLGFTKRVRAPQAG